MSYRDAPLDANPLARIATEPLHRLSDPHHLTHELLPALGLTTHAAPDLFPAHLNASVGRGVQSIQFPNQFGPYLAAMTNAGIESYLEVGVEQGGTFAITVEVLRRFGLRQAIAVDLTPPAILDQWRRPEVSFVQVDSHSTAFAELVRQHAPIDLALIDGDHSEEGVRSDFEMLRPFSRILAFHDIAQEYGFPGVGRVWRSLKETCTDEYEFQEFTDQYPELLGPRLGIGVARRRAPDS
jgi:Methyltransferase domain